MKVSTGLTLLMGGARSGKSDLVVKLGERWPGSVVFAATATAGDADMAARIERHRGDRPADWHVVEAPRLDAGEVEVIGDDSLLIVDCLTLLVANLVFDERDDAEVLAHVATLAEACTARSGPTLVVSNEVGMGVHPETPLGRRYRDLLGASNRAVADRADAAMLVVAGRVLRLEEVGLSW